MPAAGQRLGLLLTGAPEAPGFGHGLGLAEAALRRGMEVYIYCIDDAVRGLEAPRLAALASGGARLYACAYALQRRHLALPAVAAFAGLALLSDLIAGTDRFVTFD
jgi:hypothetical protein